MNSQPFSIERLKGRRVVLVSFINPNAVASIRVLGALSRWWEEYALDGLMVIGVHSPDYDFDRDPAHLRKAIQRFGLKFPVIVDSQRELWKAYSNEGWPAHYLIDPDGRIIFERLGEAGADEVEREILDALERFNGFRRAQPPPQAQPGEDCGLATQPIYLGSRRGGKVIQLSRLKVETVGESRDREVAAAGPWVMEPDLMRATATTGESGAKMRLIYRGAEALGIFSRMGNRLSRIYLKQDTLWLHSGNAGADVRWDAAQHSYIQLAEPRLYYLSKNKSGGMHDLVLIPDDPGTAFHGFEFSNFCLNNYPHN